MRSVKINTSVDLFPKINSRKNDINGNSQMSRQIVDVNDSNDSVTFLVSNSISTKKLASGVLTGCGFPLGLVCRSNCTFYN